MPPDARMAGGREPGGRRMGRRDAEQAAGDSGAHDRSTDRGQAGTNGPESGGAAARQRSARPPTTTRPRAPSNRTGAARAGTGRPAGRTGRSTRRSTRTLASTARNTRRGPGGRRELDPPRIPTQALLARPPIPRPIRPPTRTTDRPTRSARHRPGGVRWAGRPKPSPVTDDQVPDPVRALANLARALTDPRTGGLRGRAVRAVVGWLPIALGIGWLIGEVTGCGRFAATCDPSVDPLILLIQGAALVALLLAPLLASLAAGAAVGLLVAAVAATLVLSATGTAADEGSRRATLGLLLVARLAGRPGHRHRAAGPRRLVEGRSRILRACLATAIRATCPAPPRNTSSPCAWPPARTSRDGSARPRSPDTLASRPRPPARCSGGSWRTGSSSMPRAATST